jgi:putative NIF3 family GTP cyclohydrolase 1 type 2
MTTLLPNAAERAGRQLGLQAGARFGEQDLGFLGGRADNQPFADSQALAAHVRQVLGREVTCVPGHRGAIRRVAWCTGGAQSYFEAAIAAGADAFLTGEISEPQAHYARGERRQSAARPCVGAAKGNGRARSSRRQSRHDSSPTAD